MGAGKHPPGHIKYKIKICTEKKGRNNPTMFTWCVLTCTFPGSMQYTFCSNKQTSIASVVNVPTIQTKS